MDFYFGIDLLQQLRQYYEGRLSLALAKGFDQQDAKYHWLFKELECRVSTLRKLMSMISVLPEFMCRQTEEQVFAMVVSSTSSWFSDDVLGEQPKDAAGNCSYYQESNPYWVDYQLAMDRFTPDYDYTNLAGILRRSRGVSRDGGTPVLLHSSSSSSGQSTVASMTSWSGSKLFCRSRPERKGVSDDE